MTALEVVRAAIPDADASLAEHILWARTPFPVGRVTVRSLYEAASRYRRAEYHRMRLCDFCDRRAEGDANLCRSCEKAFTDG